MKSRCCRRWPKAWADGSFKGLRARGGLTVDVSWRGGKPVSAMLSAAIDGTHKIRPPRGSKIAQVRAGERERAAEGRRGRRGDTGREGRPAVSNQFPMIETSKLGRRIGAALFVLAVMAASLPAQKWEVPANAAKWVTNRSDSKLKVGGEIRGRYEHRAGQGFGASPDLDTALLRFRLSLSYRPAAWLKLSGALQDSRAPGYGVNAPNTVRNEWTGSRARTGWRVTWSSIRTSRRGSELTVGRMMLNYGESRLIGSPQWGNVTRSYDHARLYWRAPRVQAEFLWLAPAKMRLGAFDRPVLGERIWGTYNTMPNLFGKNLVEAYVLRHDQNRPGGFPGGSKAAGTDRLGVTTFGGRLTGPLPRDMKFSLEGAVQSGQIGAARTPALPPGLAL